MQQWVDMYNKADKERFAALLERDKIKKTLYEIQEELYHISGQTEWDMELIQDLINKIERLKG